MSNESTLETIRTTMEAVFDLDDLTIGPETTAADIEAWDSLSYVRLIIALERKLKIRFKSGEVDKLKNVGDLVQLIDSKK